MGVKGTVFIFLIQTQCEAKHRRCAVHSAIVCMRPVVLALQNDLESSMKSSWFLKSRFDTCLNYSLKKEFLEELFEGHFTLSL